MPRTSSYPLYQLYTSLVVELLPRPLNFHEMHVYKYHCTVGKDEDCSDEHTNHVTVALGRMRTYLRQLGQLKIS